MRFLETLCVVLIGLFTTSIAAPTSHDFETLKPEEVEPEPGQGL